MKTKELELLIQKYNHAYYSGKPLVSDQIYDGLLRNLEEVAPDSIILNAVGDVVGSEFNKITRNVKMQSIHDAFTDDEIKSWCSKHPGQYICMPKLDGASCEIEYNDGILQYATTRGDGFIGDDITHSVKTIRNLPLILAQPIDLTVRGEVIIDKKDLPEGMANCRNAAAGSLRQKDSKISRQRQLKFKAYSIVSHNNHTQLSSLLCGLRDLGFSVVDFKVCENYKKVIEKFERLNEIRDLIKCDIDGMVIGLNRYKDAEKYKNDGKYADYLLAAKFDAPSSITKLIGVELQKGRTGNITPVAILEPVEIAGSTVARASLFNQDEIDRLGVYIGATVLVKKAGDIIPQIEGVIEPYYPDNVYKIPGVCLDCGEMLDKSNVVWKCTNKYCCPEKRIEYAVSKGCLDIQGLGKSLIKQLTDMGLIYDFVDLFKFDDANFRYKLNWIDGWGTERISKIKKQIDNLEVTPEKFYKTLGIPMIGEVKAREIGEIYFNPADFIDDFTGTRLQRLQFIGDVAHNNLVIWLDSNLDLVERFFQCVTIKLPKKNLEPKIFVFTGKISQPRHYYEEKVKDAGHIFGKTLTKNTDYLVCADVNSGSSKLVKAKNYGTKIISEEDFVGMI